MIDVISNLENRFYKSLKNIPMNANPRKELGDSKPKVDLDKENFSL